MLWQRETLIYGFCTGRRRKQCLPKKRLRIVGLPHLSPPLSSPKDSSKRATDFVDQNKKSPISFAKKEFAKMSNWPGENLSIKIPLHSFDSLSDTHTGPGKYQTIYCLYFKSREKLQSRDSHSSESPFLWVFFHGSWGQLVHLDQVVRPNLE